MWRKQANSSADSSSISQQSRPTSTSAQPLDYVFLVESVYSAVKNNLKGIKTSPPAPLGPVFLKAIQFPIPEEYSSFITLWTQERQSELNQLLKSDTQDYIPAGILVDLLQFYRLKNPLALPFTNTPKTATSTTTTTTPTTTSSSSSAGGAASPLVKSSEPPSDKPAPSSSILARAAAIELAGAIKPSQLRSAQSNVNVPPPPPPKPKPQESVVVPVDQKTRDGEFLAQDVKPDSTSQRRLPKSLGSRRAKATAKKSEEMAKQTTSTTGINSALAAKFQETHHSEGAITQADEDDDYPAELGRPTTITDADQQPQSEQPPPLPAFPVKLPSSKKFKMPPPIPPAPDADFVITDTTQPTQTTEQIPAQNNEEIIDEGGYHDGGYSGVEGGEMGQPGEEVLPPPDDDVGVLPPPDEDGGVLQPQEGDGGVLPPPDDDRVVLPPPEEDVGVLPPPEEDRGVLSPPDEDGGVLPPPDEVLPPPDDDVAVSQPPDEVLPPPDEVLPPPDEVLPPPDEDVAVSQPPDEVLPPPDEVLPPPDEVLPPPDDDLAASQPPDENGGVLPPPEEDDGGVLPPPDDDGYNQQYSDQYNDQHQYHDQYRHDQYAFKQQQQQPPPPQPQPKKQHYSDRYQFDGRSEGDGSGYSESHPPPPPAAHPGLMSSTGGSSIAEQIAARKNALRSKKKVEEPPKAALVAREDPRFKKYFDKLAMGTSRGMVKRFMTNDGLDPSILDTPDAVIP